MVWFSFLIRVIVFTVFFTRVISLTHFLMNSVFTFDYKKQNSSKKLVCGKNKMN